MLQSLKPLRSKAECEKNGWTMTVSRPNRSRTTSRACPDPDNKAWLSITNGPVGTLEVCLRESLIYSSTVLGALDVPLINGIGCVTNPGVRPKLLDNCI